MCTLNSEGAMSKDNDSLRKPLSTENALLPDGTGVSNLSKEEGDAPVPPAASVGNLPGQGVDELIGNDLCTGEPKG